jgi:hypothetical protein
MINPTDIFCKTCKKPKANFSCGLCNEHVCKSCAHFIGEESFSFLKKIPTELTYNIYCTQCFDEKVGQPLAEYESTMKKAKEIIVFSKDETKKTGHLRRKELPYKVEDCEDEDETVMRLAFFAAQDGFNCLLDVHVTHRKIIVGSHKKTIFSGTAIPINMEPSRVREY